MQERERFSYLLSSGKMPFHHLSSDCTKGCHWRSFCSLQTRQSSPKWSPCPSLGEHQPPISLKGQNQGFIMGPSLGFTPSLPVSAHTLCHCHKAVPHPWLSRSKAAEQRPTSVAVLSRLEGQFANEPGRKLSALFISSEKTFLCSQIKQCVIFVPAMDEWMVESKGCL